MIAYRCPVCGCDITETTESLSTGVTYGVTIALLHVEPMDAACRWAFEALCDERRAILAAMVKSAADRLAQNGHDLT